MIKIEKFAEQMQIELEENSHKGNWENFKDTNEIDIELEYHLTKLRLSVKQKDKERIKEYIADCANLLLMLGNSYELYE